LKRLYLGLTLAQVFVKKAVMFIIEGANKEALQAAVPDRKEDIALMEPMRLDEGSRFRPELNELVFELATKSSGFRRSLPDGVAKPLADLVRSMNCYYSNLIEGHNTHPVEIERALKGEYSNDAKERNLQLEAKAHIEVQHWIDDGGLRGRTTTRDGVCEIHRRFCKSLPEELLWVENPDTHERLHVEPGEFRHNDVAVGRNIPVSPGAVPRFMDRFEAAYTGLGKAETVLTTAAMHHRFAWIHPFLDGNGRVARLMSHATLLETLDTGALWSVARGLSRSVVRYKALLANCDMTRRNDLDGRGNLSEEALVEFTRFFLKVSIDQVEFMEKLVDPKPLRARIHSWIEEEARLNKVSPKTTLLVDAILYRGEIPRGDVAHILGLSTRYSRDSVADLTKLGAISSETPYGPLRIAFPATLASRWMPGLLPDEPSK
jgi:Fic family protein